ncbi:MAG: endonuclease III [Caldilineales bacterium]|nr:endonuclease III [Caldilineales bacterium]
MPDPDLIHITKLAEMYRRLGERYGFPQWRSHGDAVDELVMTILSQNTSDVNTGRAFASLKAAFPGWQAVVDAPTEAVIEAIRSGGLANQKAPRIQNALRRILAERGAFDLDWLAELPVGEARAWLTQFDGVGNKTASIVLLFSLHRPAFPVDTHVQRVCRRVGVAPANASADRVMATVEELAPAEWYYPLHINLIRHGREMCKARNPRCEKCVLNEICAWYRA